MLAAYGHGPHAIAKGRQSAERDEGVHIGGTLHGLARHAGMKLPAETEDDDCAEHGHEPGAEIVASERPRQLDLQHRQDGNRYGKSESEKGAPPRLRELLAGTLLVFLRELRPEHLKAIVDDGLMQIPLGDSTRIKLHARIAHAEIDRCVANTGQLFERTLVAAGTSRAMHAADAEGGGAVRKAALP